MPVISIILPVYNVERFVGDAIRSVLNQDFQDWELWVVNDGSTDDSQAVIASLQADARIHSILIENSGLSVARNVGLKHATGKYVYFMDSDDMITSNLLTTVLTTAIEQNSSIVAFDYVEVAEDSKFMQDRVTNINAVENYSGIDIVHAFLGGAIHQMAWSYFCLRSVFFDNGILFSEGRLFEDNNSAAKLFSSIDQVTVLDSKMYLLRQRSGSITDKANREHNLREFMDERFVFADAFHTLEKRFPNDMDINHWYFERMVHLYNKYNSKAFHNKASNQLRVLKTDIEHFKHVRSLRLNLRDYIRLIRVEVPAVDRFIRFIYGEGGM